MQHFLFSSCAGESVGQNLYASASTDSNADPNLGAPSVQAWYDEVKDYDYANNKCNAVSPYSCGHYTQVCMEYVILNLCIDGFSSCHSFLLKYHLGYVERN